MKKLTAPKTKLIARITAIAVCCVFIGGFGVTAHAYTTPTSYVSMDVNPSIEYTLNTFDRVLSVHAVNDDGAKILQEVNLADFNNKTIDEAVKLTLSEITAKGYFDGTAPGGIVITTSGQEAGNAENLAEHLKDVITAQLTENNHAVTIEAMAVNQAQIDEAKALGVTPGKLLLVQELQSENPANTPFVTEEWLNKSVKEIMAETERLDALEDAQEDAQDVLLDAEDTAKDALEDAQDDAQDAAEDAAEAAEATQDAAQDAAEEAEDAQKDALEATAEAAEKEQEARLEAADQQKDTADQAKDATEEAAEIAADAAEEAAEAATDAAEDAAENAATPAVLTDTTTNTTATGNNDNDDDNDTDTQDEPADSEDAD